ncbi:MAG: hypothetical protein ACYDGL_08790 [Bellilinea sp.]
MKKEVDLTKYPCSGTNTVKLEKPDAHHTPDLNGQKPQSRPARPVSLLAPHSPAFFATKASDQFLGVWIIAALPLDSCRQLNKKNRPKAGFAIDSLRACSIFRNERPYIGT